MDLIIMWQLRAVSQLSTLQWHRGLVWTCNFAVATGRQPAVNFAVALQSSMDVIYVAAAAC